MILAKSRLMGPTLELARTAKPKIPTANRGALELDARSDHMEITFRLPVEKGIELMRMIKQSAGSVGAPVLLRADERGDLHIVLKESSGRTEGDSLTNRTEPLPDPPHARANVQMGDLAIHPGRHEVVYKGKAVPSLTFTEFGILYYLAKHAGWVFSREQIVEGVKGKDYPVTDRAVDVQVAGLRKKLGAAARHIQTVRGVGYRFTD